MRTRCVGHACLDVDAGGVRIVTDPWWAGPAYAGQWHPWPTPEPDDLERNAPDYVYLSHGHADHLHPDTIARLAPGATALVPEFVLAGGMAEFVHSLGFERIIALQHGRPVALRRGVTATCYLNLTDSILVLEHGGRALVDGNDALHASPEPIIDHFCRLIARNHPDIETLFLGYGGASWFPNCIRHPGKDDLADARAREDLFVRNFVRVARALRPRLACGFAASFVLLEPHNTWINDVKFEHPGPDTILRRELAGTVRAHLLLPGDRVEDGVVTPGRWDRPSRKAFDAACSGVLREAASRATTLPPITRGDVSDLAARVKDRMARHRLLPLFAPAAVELRIRDAGDAAIQVRCSRGRSNAHVGAAGEAPIAVELRSEILRTILDEPYGSETVSIGYGALAHLEHPRQLRSVARLLRGLEPRKLAMEALGAEARRDLARTSRTIAVQRWPLALNAAARFGALQRLQAALR
ncbi:MAG TPA: MBL fold metallo-hydrolase [Anaeromyxobacteraceae bacterium]|nr:MBL fold metallo-hydrolase [Anaeromyxobacteraceae bacterium]